MPKQIRKEGSQGKDVSQTEHMEGRNIINVLEERKKKKKETWVRVINENSGMETVIKQILNQFDLELIQKNHALDPLVNFKMDPKFN